jgi:predicted esterase
LYNLLKAEDEMAYKSEPEYVKEVIRLYEAGDFARAFDVLTESAARFPEELQLIYEWRFDLAARLGKPELSESIFEEALNAGYFYSERTLRTDDDLQQMQGRPVFEALVKRDLEVLAEAQQHSRPELEILYHGRESALGKPLFIALHGNNSNVSKFRQYWGALWNSEWLVALPQSSQVSGRGNFVWNDMAVVERELTEHYAALSAGGRVDPGRVLISGFSKGGYAAIDAALRGYLPIKGFLAVAPYIGNPDAMIPFLETVQNKHLRGFILAGGKDTDCIAGATRLHDAMKKRGLYCEIKVYPDLGHEFPDDFDAVLPEITSFLIGD